MECDVTPDCSNEVDPLGNFSNDIIIDLDEDDKSDIKDLNLDVEIINHATQEFNLNKCVPQSSQKLVSTTNNSLGTKTVTATTSSAKSPRVSSPSKVLKHHSLRRNIPRLLGKSIPPNSKEEPVNTQASTMREVLASIPGFSIKRRRTNKKMSTAAQIEQTREGCIDLETPDSILVGTNLRELLNKHTFSILPPLYQLKLVQLLPSVDQPSPIDTESHGIRLSSSSLNNEFFARACLEWRERLSEGEFTPENQLKLKTEAEKEKNRLDPWKLKHFEPIWGDKGQSAPKNDIALTQRPSLKTTIKLRPTTSIATSTTSTINSYTTSSSSSSMETTMKIDIISETPSAAATNNGSPITPPTTPKKVRTVGAVTRAVTGCLQQTPSPNTKIPNPVPDLLPIRTKTPRSTDSVDSINLISPKHDQSSDCELILTTAMSITTAATTATTTPTIIKIHHHTPPSFEIIKLNENEANEIKHIPKNIPADIQLIPIPLSDNHKISSQNPPPPPLPSSNHVLSQQQFMASLEDGKKLQKRSCSPEHVQSKSIKLHDTFHFSNSARTVRCEPVKVREAVLKKEEPPASIKEEMVEFKTEVIESSISNDSSQSFSCDSEGIESSYCPSNNDINSHESKSSDYNGSCKNDRIIEDVDSKDYYNRTEENNVEIETNTTSDDVMKHDEYAIQSHHQTFDGVLQIQPNSLILHQENLGQGHHHNHHLHHHHHHMHHHGMQNDTELIVNQGEDELSMVGSSVATCDEGSNSNSTNCIIHDGSGDNSMDTAVDELEPTIQNIPLGEEDVEQKLTDAENYIKESGEITVPVSDNERLHHMGTKLCGGQDIPADLFAAAVARAFDTVNVPVAMTVVNPTENTEVIPMQETLEVRLEESTFRVPNDWNFNPNLGMGSMNSAATVKTESNSVITQRRNSYSTASQVKLELEVTLTPEAEVSSTVVNHNSSQSIDGDSSNCFPSFSKSNTMPTVIPPTTIVCLPSVVSVSNPIITHHHIPPVTSSSVIHNFGETRIKVEDQNSSPVNSTHSQKHQAPLQKIMIQNQQIVHQQQQQQQSPQSPSVLQQQQQHQNVPPSLLMIPQRTAVVASSSSVPYLSISTNQPLRAVANTITRPKGPSSRGGRGNRSNNNNKPPGEVNLERSYQICQAVIQNSPNRHQLRQQLRPPPSLFATKKDDLTQYSAVTSSNKMNIPRMGFPKTKFMQRQQSPVLVRHVLTSNQGIPVSMALLPSNNNQQSSHNITVQSQQTESLPAGTAVINNVGQYVLVQQNSTPRASSAPPAQNQQIHGVNGVPISGRGRPASVDVDPNSMPETQPNGPNVGLHAVSRRINPSISYGDISMDPTIQNFSVIAGENTPPNCTCSLNPMVICQQCGAFCHDDCVGSTKLCVSCVIR